jgi:NADPH:quinone reductase-like Zn-dependent oxidoreductase
MKAAQINEYGDTSVIQINEISQPQPKPGQVLVKVVATSLNPFDTKLREGYMKAGIPLKFPATLGGDFAGTIAELGPNIAGLAVGDKVYGQANVVAGNSGSFAEFAVTKVSEVAKMPSNVDFEQAASLPLVGVSALQALVQHIKLQSGQKLFIHGAAGGIGTIAVQIAKHVGAYVAGTATGGGAERVVQLGVDEVIDYKVQDFAAQLHDFDAVFDTVGGDDFARALAILKPGGVAVSMIAQADEQAKELGVTAITQSTKVTTEMLDKLRELVESGVVTPQVGKIFLFEQIQQAFEARESGKIPGKVVVIMSK